VTVTLRPAGPEDAPLHVRWFSDPEVTHWLGRRYPASLAATEQRLSEPRTFADQRFTLVADTGEPIGYSALRGATPENRAAELDLVVGERAYWGRGHGTEAARATARHGFDRLGLHRVHVWVVPENTAAVRAYERAGFVHEGRARDRVYTHGRFHDALLMSVLPGELR
jgi:RimJ/RimL family protein N-acetyltransferase